MISGGELNCVDFVSPGGSFGPIVVWPSAQPGAYDLVVLLGSKPFTIVAGDELGAAVGLIVRATVPTARWPLLACAGLALLFLGLPRVRRQASR
jgi:hypothetical protein